MSDVVDEPGSSAGEAEGGVPAEGSTVATAVAVLEYLTKALVSQPDEVQVEVEEANGLTLNITVADGDMGRVIGKRGRVASSIRVLGRAAAAKDGEGGVAIEFVD